MIKYNENLGFLPVSNFINCHAPTNYIELHKFITSSECKDIVFYNFYENEEVDLLKWVIPRLLSENFFITLLTDIKYIPEDLIYSRIVCSATLDDIRGYSTITKHNLSLLTEHDALYVNEINFDLFNKVVQNSNGKPEIFYNKVLEEVILSHKRYTYFKLNEILNIVGRRKKYAYSSQT